MGGGNSRQCDVDNGLVAFADACEEASSLAVLSALWIDRITTMGFLFTALGSHVDSRNPQDGAFLLHNYPSPWIDHFSTHRLHLMDPVYRSAEQQIKPFLCNDPDFIATLTWRQRRVLAEAREFGLRFGRTHALASSIYLPASCSLVADGPDVPPEVYAVARAMSVFVHYRASQLCARQARPALLTLLPPKERRCLEFVARGREDREIAEALGVGVPAVRRAIERARARLGADTRGHAIALAIKTGQIAP